MIHTRIERLAFAATRPKAGHACSVIKLLNPDQLNHRVEVTGGILEFKTSIMLTGVVELRRSN